MLRPPTGQAAALPAGTCPERIGLFRLFVLKTFSNSIPLGPSLEWAPHCYRRGHLPGAAAHVTAPHRCVSRQLPTGTPRGTRPLPRATPTPRTRHVHAAATLGRSTRGSCGEGKSWRECTMDTDVVKRDGLSAKNKCDAHDFSSFPFFSPRFWVLLFFAHNASRQSQAGPQPAWQVPWR